MGLSSLSHAGLMEAAVKECIRDMLDHERRLREMPAKRYIVRLTQDERTELLGLITKGIISARLLTRARILLKADEGWMCMKCPTTPLIQPSALMRNPSN